MTSRDPTTDSIVAQNQERDQLRVENQRLRENLSSARGVVERVRDEAFVTGYDQAVEEIRDCFAKSGNFSVVHVIETTWLRKKS